MIYNKFSFDGTLQDGGVINRQIYFATYYIVLVCQEGFIVNIMKEE
jgi:hypothetical protein